MANDNNIKPHEFKPGKSGNPKGRPEGIPNARTRYRRFLDLTEKIKNPVSGIEEIMTVMEALDLMQIAKARKGELASYKEIVDRMEGRPSENKENPEALNIKFEVINRVPEPKD